MKTPSVDSNWFTPFTKPLTGPSVKGIDAGPLLAAPRSCNTGALISSATTSKIDWLEMTVSGVDWRSYVENYLSLDPDFFVEAEYGMQGYPDLFTYGGVKVLTSLQKPERGSKVILSGSALDEVGNDAVDIIRLGLKDGASFARIDIAIDDRRGKYDFDFLFSEVFEHQKDVHRFTQIEPRAPVNARTREVIGRSIQFGKASSSRFLIIYDKQLERISAGEDDPGSWIRFESRWYKQAAYNAAVEIAEKGLAVAGSLIRGMVDFRENDNDNESRRTPCAWWLEVVDSLEIIRTGIKKQVKTINDKLHWVTRQCSKTLGQIVSIVGSKTLIGIIEYGIDSTTEKEWKILDPLGSRNFMPLSDVRNLSHICPF